MSNLTKEQRHRNMQANKSKGTSIEILLGQRKNLRDLLFRHKF